MTECLIAMALAGSGAYLLWRALLPLTRERFSARWQYGFLKTVLAFFLLPVGLLGASLGLALPAAASGVPDPSDIPPGLTAPAPPSPVDPVDTRSAEAAAALPPQKSGRAASPNWRDAVLPALTALWFLGAAVLGGREIFRRARFRRAFLPLCLPVEDGESLQAAALCRRQTGLRRLPRLAVSPLPCSPFVTGLVHPVIVLPGGEIGEEKLRCILLHEMLHIRRRDLWVRALALWVRTLYWFNPLVWRLSRQTAAWSELACDEAVTAPMDREGRRVYGRVILQAALQNAGNAGEWAATLAAPETMKWRLKRMFEWKEMKKSAHVAAALTMAVLIAGGSLAAMGAYRPAPEEAPPVRSQQSTGAAAPARAGAADQAAPPAAPEKLPAPREGQSGAQTVAAAEPPVDPESPQSTAQSGAEDTAAPEPPLPAEQSPTPDAPADGTQYPVDSPAQREALIAQLCGDYGLTQQDFIIHINGEDGSEIVEIYRDATWLAELAAKHLIDGDWPRNSRGESYGPDALYRVTGTHPDLVSAVGQDGTHGYIRERDRWENHFDIHTCEDARSYMVFMEAIRMSYYIPLYNAEGEAIGCFLIAGGVATAEGLQRPPEAAN